MTHRRLLGVCFLFIVALVCAAVIVIVDQVTKLAVVNTVKPVGSVTVIKNILDFTYVENRGAAFGMMQNKRWLFIICTAAAIILMICYSSVFRFFRPCAILPITLLPQER